MPHSRSTMRRLPTCPPRVHPGTAMPRTTTPLTRGGATPPGEAGYAPGSQAAEDSAVPTPAAITNVVGTPAPAPSPSPAPAPGPVPGPLDEWVP